jgi:3-hydroxyisobutyrate dehydrogenase
MTIAKQHLGFIGLGLMGNPMCSRLIESGLPMTVWNRTESKTTNLVDLGAISASSPLEVAKNSDVVFLCLTDKAAVREVVFGNDGLTSKKKPSTIVDFSTIGFQAAAELGKKLNNCKVEYVDAPVTGGVVGATNGTLSVFVGGKTSAVTEVRPMLECIGSKIMHMGSIGTGQATKVCNQVMVFNTIVTMAEMLKLAEESGLPSKELSTIFAGGFANSRILEVFGEKMASRDETVTGKLKVAKKDLDLILSLGEETNTSLPMSDTAARMIRLAIEKGLGEADITQLIQLYDN